MSTSSFFKNDIVTDFSKKIESTLTDKYMLYNTDKLQSIEYVINYLFTNICIGIGSLYSTEIIKSYINNPKLFDMVIIVDTKKNDVKEELDNVVGFIIVEMGECHHFPNAYSIKLICSKSGLATGTILMGLYLYSILSHQNKYDNIGILELAASYENVGGLCMYEKFGFKYEPHMRINDKKGEKCFNDIDNLPMIVNLNNYIGDNVEEKQKMIIDITNRVKLVFEKSKICNIKNKNIQKLVGYLKILKHYFDFKISLNIKTKSNVIELYYVFDNNRDVLDYIIRYIEDTTGEGKNEYLNKFITNLMLYNTKKKIQIGDEINKEINDMIDKINIVMAKKRQQQKPQPQNQTQNKNGGGKKKRRTIKKKKRTIKKRKEQ